MSWSLAVFALVASLLALGLTPAQSQDFILTDLSEPYLQDVEHDEFVDTYVGELLAISTTVVNGEAFAKRIAVIIETRDIAGITTDVQVVNGTVYGESYVEFSALWRPEIAGEYEFRAFAISDFVEARILTGVKTSHWSVSA
jgi:hypothetical protein